MKRLTMIVLLITISGCGSDSPGDSSARTSSAPTRTVAASTTTTAAAVPATDPTPAATPSLSAAEDYVRTLAPYYRDELRKRGAQKFGKAKVQCAATGRPDVECVTTMTYLRLDECMEVTGHVFVIVGDDGLEQKSNDGLTGYKQACYIGPDGESLPDRP